MGVDNINFSPVHSTPENDLFNGASLIAAGHAFPIKLIKMAKAPTVKSNAAPSWVISIEPSSRNPWKEGDLVKQAAERDGAPLPIAKRALSTLRKWDMKTLYQSQGDSVEVVTVDSEGNKIGSEFIAIDFFLVVRI